MHQITSIPTFQLWTDYLMAWLDRRVEDMLTKMSTSASSGSWTTLRRSFRRPGSSAMWRAHPGSPQLERAVAHGYFPAATLSGRPQFEALRGDPAFQKILKDAEAGRARALAAFREAGGERLLGRR